MKTYPCRKYKKDNWLRCHNYHNKTYYIWQQDFFIILCREAQSFQVILINSQMCCDIL
jgi:hypothetical protein